MPPLIPPRSQTSTLTDPTWTPIRVVVHLDEPLVADLHRPMLLDGPLAWCAYLEHVEATGRRPRPIRADTSPLDFDLGLATWTAPPTAAPTDGRALGADGLAWGWACSAHTPIPGARTAVHLRRRPADQAMARYTGDRRHHLGAGPYKARNDLRPAAWIGDIVWHALGDPTRVTDLLTRLRSIGQLARHGYGRVRSIDVTCHDDRQAWQARPMPGPGPVASIRAPHHHPTRHMPCTS